MNISRKPATMKADFFRIIGSIEGSEITILNVYAPPGSDWIFYRKMSDLMVGSQGTVVCGVDFNFRLNPKIDSSKSAHQDTPLTKKVNLYLEELGIIGVWRELHNNWRLYTLFRFIQSLCQA